MGEQHALAYASDELVVAALPDRLFVTVDRHDLAGELVEGSNRETRVLVRTAKGWVRRVGTWRADPEQLPQCCFAADERLGRTWVPACTASADAITY